MFTLAGAVIGFVAMLAARGRAGIAAGLAVLGLVLGIGSSIVYVVETVPQNVDASWIGSVDWSFSNWIAGVAAALPGVLGAIFARRD